MSNLFNTDGAEISEDGKYRWRLWRVWDQALPRVLWIMLNPSTADATENDPTLKRCISFSEKFGFGSLEVVNLCPERSPDPDDVDWISYKHGCVAWHRNIQAWSEATRECSRMKASSSIEISIIAGWGEGPKKFCQGLNQRPMEVLPKAAINYFGSIDCLHVTKKGHPGHPLYLPASSELVPYSRFGILLARSANSRRKRD